ncbi:MAG: hypothetical protein Q8P67_27940 [archaeon]|nr:hypothetical protein [archaeon]
MLQNIGQPQAIPNLCFQLSNTSGPRTSASSDHPQQVIWPSSPDDASAADVRPQT